MKRQTIFIIAILVVVAFGLILLSMNSNKNDKIETVDDIKLMINSIYDNLKNELPELETTELDVSDLEQVTRYSGLNSNDNIEKMVISMPMMNAQAYLLTVLKVKDNSNIEELKTEMLENINMRMWVCVSAEKLYITNYGNIIFMIMADENWSNSVYTEFKKYVNNEVGKELEKSEETDIELPPEILQ